MMIMKKKLRTFGAKKASVFLSVFFILMLISLFYLISLGVKNDSHNYEITKQEQASLGSYGELIKSYSENVLEEATLRAAFFSALNGGGAINNYWVTYGASSAPQLYSIKSSISTKAEATCNNYLKTINGLKLASANINKPGIIEHFDVLVNQSLFSNETYANQVSDSFKVTAYGSSAVLASLINGDKRLIQHSYTEQIYPLRFWYIYKNLKEWADSGILASATCESEELIQGVGGMVCKGPKVDNKTTIDNIMKVAIKNLTDRLNKDGDFVSCSYQIPCRYAKTTYLCCCADKKCPSSQVTPGGDNCFVVHPKCGSGCDWLDPNKCNPVCNHYGGGKICLNKDPCVSGSCSNNPMKFVGSNKQLDVEDLNLVPLPVEQLKAPNCNEPEPSCSKVTIKYDPLFNKNSYTYEPCGKVCMAKTGEPCHGFGENHTLEFTANVLCVDKKYYLPVSIKSPEPLKFRFRVHVFLNHWVPPPPPPSVDCNIIPVDCPKPCHCKKKPKPKPTPPPPDNGKPTPSPTPPSPPPPPPPPPSGSTNINP